MPAGVDFSLIMDSMSRSLLLCSVGSVRNALSFSANGSPDADMDMDKVPPLTRFQRSSVPKAADADLLMGGRSASVSSAVAESPPPHSLQALWPPPCLVRCVEGPGFSLSSTLQAYYLAGESSGKK